jgi:hypothetical protein
MSDTQEHKSAQDLRAEDIWAMFHEVGLRFEEVGRRFEEVAREAAERSRELDRRFAEAAREAAERSRELDRQFKETDRKISNLGSRIGALIENLVASNLKEKFMKRGLNFTRSSPNVLLMNADGSFLAEIDILLENGNTALAVEVKSKLTTSDVTEHLERMEKLRRYADERGDTRKFLGAVAGGIVPENAGHFAIESGFFVIEQSGDTAVIAVPDDFVPRMW